MSQQTGNNTDLQSYLHAWARMMITIWEEKLILLSINDTWELYKSFEQHVMMHSGGDGAKVAFAFREYGMYVNAGVGKEVFVGNDGDLIDVAKYQISTDTFQLERSPKPWFDQGWFKSIYALRRDVARIYGDRIAKGIVFQLTGRGQAQRPAEQSKRFKEIP